jgi:hypothetical protein
MATTDINNLISKIEADYQACQKLKSIKDNLETTKNSFQTIEQTNKQLSDINSSSLRRQRAELDTKKRIIDYTEQDIGKNYSILSTQFILFIVISSMVLFMIAYALFVDSDFLQGIKDTVASKISQFSATSSAS